MKWITAINSPLNLALFTIVILGTPVPTAPIANVTEWRAVATPDVMPECGVRSDPSFLQRMDTMFLKGVADTLKATCLINIMPRIACESPDMNETCSPCTNKEVVELLQTCLLETCKLTIVETFRELPSSHPRSHCIFPGEEKSPWR